MTAHVPSSAATSAARSIEVAPPTTPASSGSAGPAMIVGTSPQIARLRRLIEAVATKDCTVLITGESGTGKELVARSIHTQSRRGSGPFVAVDCTGLRDTLLESQLFGHVKGASTGAETNTMGFIRAADGGTLFLDEVGEMDLKTQAKLLRCIQERSVVPLGSVKPVDVDVRILCATHRDLRAMVDKGEFREDLFFRLDVVRLAAPALRERRSDVPGLAEHFLNLLSELYGEPRRALAPDAVGAMMAYSWPGNVRELANAIEHAAVFSTDGLIRLSDLPERIRAAATSIDPVRAASGGEMPLMTLDAMEKALISRVLVATNGNQSKAAAILQIERRRLYRKVKRHGLAELCNGAA